jgi:hypothetical protein
MTKANSMHESGELKVVEDVYSTYVVFSLPGFNIDTGDVSLVTKEMQNQRDEAERALALLADPAVKLDFVDYDKHYGGSLAYRFETTDVAVARKYEFEEVLPAGEEDSEPTPWSWAMQPSDNEDRAGLATMVEKATALGIDIAKAYKTYGLVGTEMPTTNGQVDRAYCALKYAIDKVEKAQAALKSAQATLAQAVRS